MDMDDLELLKKKTKPMNLEIMSLDALREYILELEAEISRARTEIATKEMARRGAEEVLEELARQNRRRQLEQPAVAGVACALRYAPPQRLRQVQLLVPERGETAGEGLRPHVQVERRCCEAAPRGANPQRARI